MERSLSILLGAAILATLGSSQLVPQTARAAAEAETCPADGTHRAALSGEHASLATDIAAVGGRAAWIVGMHAGQGIPRRPWILRADGSGWRTVTAAPTGDDGGLMAVDAAGSRSAWAVGFHTTSRFLRPVAQRWDGHRWTAVAVPSRSRSEALVDVAIAREGAAWTVGYRSTSRGPAPTALLHRPGGWVRHDPPLARGWFGSLVAVDVAPDGTTWAVGWQGDGHATRPLLLAYEGGRWHSVTAGLSAAGETVLTDVVAGPGARVRVLGYQRVGREQRGFLWHRDADGWHADASLTAIDGAMLPTGMAVDGDGRIAIAAAWRGPSGAGFAATAAVRTADGWRIARAPDGIRAPSELHGVTWAGGTAWAVGWMGGMGVAAGVCDAGSLPLADASSATAGRTQHDGSRGRRARAGDTSRRRPRIIAATATSPATGIRFVDVAGRVGLSSTTTSYGATVLDLDGDGWEDILLSRHTERGRLLRNLHGRFVAAAGDPLPARDRHGCTAADIDQDGHVDAFCALGAARGAKLKTNELWMDLRTQQPRQVSAAFGVDDPLGRGRRATFLDLDGDPYPDLVVTSDPLRVDGLPSLARAFLDDSGRGFVPADGLGLELPIGGSCAVSADLDDDGRQEVLVCTEEAWGSGTGLHVFRRGSGGFRDATSALGVRPRGDVDAAVGDLDRDGRTDLVQVSRGRLTVSLQRAGGMVVVATFGLTAGTAVAVGDANGDRHPDIYVVEGGTGRNAEDRLLLNTGTGRSFRSVAIPQARAGTADDVVVLDHDHNGTDDFLVLNGAQTAGPIQLIAGFR